MANGTPNITTANRSNGAVVGSTANNNFEVGWTSSSGLDILVDTYVQYGYASGSVNDNDQVLGRDEATSYTRNTTIGLDADTNYQWRGLAINVDTGQTGTGSTQNFKTNAAQPTCPTPSSSSITGTSATITANSYNMNVVASSGTAYLQYKKASAGSWTTATSSVTTSGNLSSNLTGLSMGTLYDVRVLIERNTENATSVAGTTHQFTTLAPSATTNAASDITSTTATLNGTYNAQNAVIGAPVTVRFEWGSTPSYGNTVTITTSATGSGSTPTSTGLTGLTPSTTYYFRLVALNADATTNGAQETFTTSSGQSPIIIF